jgi:hypothetical protein
MMPANRGGDKAWRVGLQVQRPYLHSAAASKRRASAVAETHAVVGPSQSSSGLIAHPGLQAALPAARKANWFNGL